MKKNTYISILLIIIILSLSCGKSFLDVNEDPNNPEEATVDVVFPAGVASTAGQIGSYYNILGCLWSQYWTQNNGSNQYKTWDGFSINSTDLQNEFNELYSGALLDYKYVIEKSAKDKNWSYYLMATVMQVYTYQVLADLYDQIPYTEALLGSENYYPHFDNGEIIYDGLIAQLDSALAKDFNATTVKDPGSSDFLFEGDINQWIRFANTLKLKIYLRQCYARPSVSQNGIMKMYNNNAEFLTKDAAITQFLDEENHSNPLFECDQRKLNTNQNLKASKTFLSFLETNNDPRIPVFFRKNAAGNYLALEQGNFNVPSTVIDPLSISRALILATDPVYFICSSESYLLQAEALERYYAGDGAQALYNLAITASFNRYGMASYAPSFYGVEGAYEYPVSGTFEDKLEAIITQKWLALAGVEGIEMFFERNRTQYPKISPVPASSDSYIPGQFTYPLEGVTNGVWTKRLLFPDTEQSRNPNCPAQVPITQKVWWDKK